MNETFATSICGSRILDVASPGVELGGAAQQQLLATFVVLLSCWGCVRWAKQGSSAGMLSKGSMGWPILGETLSFLSSSANHSTEHWLRVRLTRYGSLFKSHLLLQPCVVATTPEEVKYVLDDPDHGFGSGAPHALTRIFGRKSILVLSGKAHEDMHKLLFDSLILPVLRPKISEMERLLEHSMRSWDGNTVDFVGSMQLILLKVMTLNFFGVPWEDELSDKIVRLLLPAFMGINCLPLYIPGTTYYKARQARNELNALLIPIIRRLRDSQSDEHNAKYAKMAEFPYKSLLKYKDPATGKTYSDEGVVDILVGTILAGIHAPTMVIALSLKYLAENPSCLEILLAETDHVRATKEASGEPFSPLDLKKLKYTSQVFHEVLRLSNIASGVSRTASKDMNFNGYVIPKGWRVLTVFSIIHLTSEFYPDPLKFDPDRFQVPPNPKRYLPFGRGTRTCVGRDLTRLLICMTLYHITSKFTWDIVRSGSGLSVLPITQFRGPFEVVMKSRPAASSQVNT